MSATVPLWIEVGYLHLAQCGCLLPVQHLDHLWVAYIADSLLLELAKPALIQEPIAALQVSKY